MRFGWFASSVMALVAAPLVALAQIPMPVAKPVVKVGDRWKFVVVDPLTKVARDATEQVVSEVAADGFIVVETAPATEAKRQRYDPEWNGFQEVNGRMEHQVRVRFPLEPGKTWSSKYEWINARNRHGQLDMSYKVGQPERVTVPAGTFEAIPIEASGTWRNFTTGASGIAMEKRWYAPAARTMVRRTWVTRYAGGAPDQDTVFELQEMELKP